MIEGTIRGIQEAQRANLELIAALQPRGALGRAIQWALAEAHRYAVAITHVDTGSWRASHRIEMDERRARGSVFVDPASVNPRSKVRPAEYAAYWEGRGGEMAVYLRTVTERGGMIVAGAERILGGGMPK